MPAQGPSFQPFQDPYFRVTPLPNTQFVQAARPIVLTQDGTDLDLVVNVAADKDVIVFADLVTISGPIQVRRPATGTAGSLPAVKTGGRVTILARRVDTLPDPNGYAKLDVTGETGWRSPNALVTPPHKGVGDPGLDGTPTNPGIKDSGTPGGPGQSTMKFTQDKDHPFGGLVFDIMSPLNGQNGSNGGDGGAGGSVDIRCYSLAATAALAVDAGGGTGGDGTDGQPGAKGGPGGAGGSQGSGGGQATPGGSGGFGGKGGTGGIPGQGGAPGSISVRLLNGPAKGVTCSLDAGNWGKPGLGGKGGDGGEPGKGGTQRFGTYPKPDGAPGGRGQDGGSPPAYQFKRGEAGKPSIALQCDARALLEGLTLPLTPYLSMLLDTMRADYLESTASTSDDALEDFRDRLDWVATLAAAYAPIDPAEQAALDTVLARTEHLQQHLKRGLDYFGHSPTYVRLGALSAYKSQFGQDLATLRQVWGHYQSHLDALDQATATTQQLDAAKDKLASDKQAYLDGQTAERTEIAAIAARINGNDADAVAAKQRLVKKTTDAFRTAIKNACGLTPEDLFDILGQFAFLGEKPFQAGAMIASQAGKLIDDATSKCLADDGTAVPKDYVISQLHAVDDLDKALSGYTGTIDGVKLADPGAVKLLGMQSQLDDLCDKFWTYPDARALKAVIEDYVTAVQARNADILELNGAIARLHGYIAGAAQADAALAEAKNAKSQLSAPGAPALVTQLARMVTRATDDCVRDLYRMSRAYWMWSLQPGDELAKYLKEIGADDPLAITPDVLASAAQGLGSDYTDCFTAQLEDAGGWFPKPDHDGVWWPARGARGVRVVLTHADHPRFIEELRKGHSTIAIMAPHPNTKPGVSPFAGYADVRITKVRPWVFGAKLGPKATKKTIRVDLTHTGRETFVAPDGAVTVLTHDPVSLAFEYAPAKPDVPASITFDGTLFNAATPAPGCLIGPFTRWRVAISKKYNDPSLNIKAIDKVVLEFFGHKRPFPVASGAAPALAAQPARAR